MDNSANINGKPIDFSAENGSLIGRITAQTRLLAVAGSPIRHSLSPLIHNRFIRETNLPYVYLAFESGSGHASELARAIRTLGIAGINITMPLKVEILPELDEIDSAAALLGAVNTIVNDGGRLIGYNTDGEGFLLALERAGFYPGGSPHTDRTFGRIGFDQLDRVLYNKEGNIPDLPSEAVILGAGGAARTAAIALAGCGVRVYLASRRGCGGINMPGISQIKWDKNNWSEIAKTAQRCSLLVNATPLGMEGCGDDFDDFGFLGLFPADILICDMIYAPRKTKLIQAAETAGIRAVNGLAYLVYQAAIAFWKFTGEMPGDGVVDELLLEI